MSIEEITLESLIDETTNNNLVVESHDTDLITPDGLPESTIEEELQDVFLIVDVHGFDTITFDGLPEVTIEELINNNTNENLVVESHDTDAITSDGLPESTIEELQDDNNETIVSEVTFEDLNELENKDNITLTTIEAIAQYRLVSLDSNGFAKLADATNSDVNLIGIGLSNVAQNGQISVKPHGKIYNDSWNFDVSLPIFLGKEGQISQIVEPDYQVLIRLGTLQNSKTIYLNIEEPILLC